MPKDDMFKIIYCILKELYECMKQGANANIEDINYTRFGIPYSYWLDIIIQMQERNLVSGVMYRKTKGTGRVANYDDDEVYAEFRVKQLLER